MRLHAVPLQFFCSNNHRTRSHISTFFYLSTSQSAIRYQSAALFLSIATQVKSPLRLTLKQTTDPCLTIYENSFWGFYFYRKIWNSGPTPLNSLGDVSLCHSWHPAQLSDWVKRDWMENCQRPVRCDLPARRPTLISLCCPPVTVSTAWWGMVKCLRVRSGRPCHLPPITSLTTWWPSWTLTVWGSVTPPPCSIMWRNIRNAVKLLGK